MSFSLKDPDVALCFIHLSNDKDLNHIPEDIFSGFATLIKLNHLRLKFSAKGASFFFSHDPFAPPRLICSLLY